MSEAPTTLNEATQEASEDSTTMTTSWGGFDIRPVNEVAAKQGECIILYGTGGSGKTTLAASIADSVYGQPCVMLEAEGGTRSIAHRTNVDIITVKNWKDIERFTQGIKRDINFPWRGVILDNLSEYADLIKRDVAGVTDMPTQPEWGRITNTLKDLVRVYRDVARDRGYTVVICAWDEEIYDDMNRAKHQLAFTPAFRKELPGLVDMVGHISVERGGMRVVNFALDPKRNQAKFRRSGDEAAASIPLTIPYTLDKLPLPDILATLREGKPWPSAKYQQQKKDEK